MLCGLLRLMAVLVVEVAASDVLVEVAASAVLLVEGTCSQVLRSTSVDS